MKWKDEKTISSDAISNVFLFLCKPDYYLPIPAQDKKSLINKNLSDLINNDALPSEEDEVVKNMCEIDRNLYKIRKKIREIYGKLADEQQPVDTGLKDTFSKIAGMLNPFWQPNIRPFWENTTQDLKSNELSDEVLLEYKKAMVLHGPPGTSKSYQARRMAENLIAQALRKEQKDIKTCLTTISYALNKHIHKLQLHPNYTYDDFIVGKTIKENSVVTKNGFMRRRGKCPWIAPIQPNQISWCNGT